MKVRAKITETAVYQMEKDFEIDIQITDDAQSNQQQARYAISEIIDKENTDVTRDGDFITSDVDIQVIDWNAESREMKLKKAHAFKDLELHKMKKEDLKELRKKGILEATDQNILSADDWIQVISEEATDTKYGRLMYSPSLKVLRSTTMGEFYGTGIVD